MKFVNYHTHTTFSDGREAPVDYVEAAIDQGLKAIGFSDHAPLPLDCSLAMKSDRLREYIDVIRKLRNKFAGKIEIYCGMEVDYIPGIVSIQDPHLQDLPLDYTIGAIHFVDQFQDGTPWSIDSSTAVFRAGINQIFDGDIRIALARYFELIREMVLATKPTVVAHLDRIKISNPNNQFYSENAPWYRKEMEKTLTAIAQSGAIMEINTKGVYRKQHIDPYPGTWAINLAREMKIPIHLGSDAHHPRHLLSGFDYVKGLLAKAGYRETTVLLEGTWQEVPLG